MGLSGWRFTAAVLANFVFGALMCIGIMLAVGALGAGIVGFSQFAGVLWLPIPILTALAFGAFALYITGLNKIDSLALEHRESLVEELSKAS